MLPVFLIRKSYLNDSNVCDLSTPKKTMSSLPERNP